MRCHALTMMESTTGKGIYSGFFVFRGIFCWNLGCFYWAFPPKFGVFRCPFLVSDKQKQKWCLLRPTLNKTGQGSGIPQLPKNIQFPQILGKLRSTNKSGGKKMQLMGSLVQVMFWVNTWQSCRYVFFFLQSLGFFFILISGQLQFGVFQFSPVSIKAAGGLIWGIIVIHRKHWTLTIRSGNATELKDKACRTHAPNLFLLLFGVVFLVIRVVDFLCLQWSKRLGCNDWNTCFGPVPNPRCNP